VFEDRSVLRVGAIVSALLVLAVVFALQIDFRDLGPTAKIRVFLTHPGPLRAGADVQLGGRKVGRVHSIRLVSSNEARDPKHLLHPEGGVLCEAWIRKKYLSWVRLNGELFVNTKGLIGESYMEIAPPPGDQEMQRPIRDGDELRGIDPARMEHVLVTSFQNARRFGALLEELEPSMLLLRQESSKLSATIATLQPEPTTFSAIGASVDRARESFDELRADFSGTGPTLRALNQQTQTLIKQVRRDLEALDLELGSFSEKLELVRGHMPANLTVKYQQVARDAEQQLATLRATIATLRDLATRIESGNGTIGALINDPEFSDDAKQLGRYLKRHPWELLTRPLD
jgi:ABC-type transporter Mla subunit MlaD